MLIVIIYNCVYVYEGALPVTVIVVVSVLVVLSLVIFLTVLAWRLKSAEVIQQLAYIFIFKLPSLRFCVAI